MGSEFSAAHAPHPAMDTSPNNAAILTSDNNRLIAILNCV
jgi:hypothetical protein